MRVFLFAIASVALALEETHHADVGEYLSLLQLSARPHSVAESSDDVDAHDADDLDAPASISYPITWDTRRSFGPDGTWATPYCKNIQGCTLEERVCPPGCDGTAYWERTPYGNTKFGIPNGWAQRNTAHFIGCIQGLNRGGAFGSWQVHNHMQNCNNGPDSKSPTFFSSDAEWVQQNIGTLSSGINDATQTAYGQEWCPANCVNDCAMFKNGQFLACGMTDPAQKWAGYNGANTNIGPNPMCQIGVMKTFYTSSYTWCGEPTTTTTTTPPPPPVEEPVDEPDGDEAGAIGDPHMTSNTGRHFDLE
jgi:hypothetical protein